MAREPENAVEGHRRTGTTVKRHLQRKMHLKSKSVNAMHQSKYSQLGRKGRMTVDDILNADFMAGSDDDEEEEGDEVGVFSMSMRSGLTSYRTLKQRTCQTQTTMITRLLLR